MKIIINYRELTQSGWAFTTGNMKYLVKIAELMQDLLRNQTTGYSQRRTCQNIQRKVYP